MTQPTNRNESTRPRVAPIAPPEQWYVWPPPSSVQSSDRSEQVLVGFTLYWGVLIASQKLVHAQGGNFLRNAFIVFVILTTIGIVVGFVSRRWGYLAGVIGAAAILFGLCGLLASVCGAL